MLPLFTDQLANVAETQSESQDEQSVWSAETGETTSFQFERTPAFFNSDQLNENYQFTT